MQDDLHVHAQNVGFFFPENGKKNPQKRLATKTGYKHQHQNNSKSFTKPLKNSEIKMCTY